MLCLETDKLLEFELPTNIKLHVIGFGTRPQINSDLFSTLAWKTKGMRYPRNRGVKMVTKSKHNSLVISLRGFQSGENLATLSNY